MRDADVSSAQPSRIDYIVGLTRNFIVKFRVSLMSTAAQVYMLMCTLFEFE